MASTVARGLLRPEIRGLKDLHTARKFSEKLFVEGSVQEHFLRTLLDGRARRPALVWMVEPRQEDIPDDLAKALEEAPDWIPSWVSLVGSEFAVGKSQLWHEGIVYSLDFSSVWAASALMAAKIFPDGLCTILDMCAAPGGKSILASRFLSPDRLVSNEVIGKRLAILRANLRRCRVPHAFTQRRDPSEIATMSPGSFQVVLVDAPCSGQSLVARGVDNPGCFHPRAIRKNTLRQRRILGESMKCVALGGNLLYTTCTFSVEENERIIEWALKRFPEFQAKPVPHLEPWRSNDSAFPCYRLYPMDGLGAGAFVTLLERESSPEVEEAMVDEELFEFPTTEER